MDAKGGLALPAAASSRKWIFAPPHEDLSRLAAAFAVPALIAQLLANRKIECADQSRSFLSPMMKDLFAPAELPGARKAADQLLKAIRDKTPIVIYGDYDVDGVTGTAILWHMIRAMGGSVSFYVPHRVDEGYGLSGEAISSLIDDGARLIVSVDCGITACEQVAQARERGANVIITDHHAPAAVLPEASAIVHPTACGPSPNEHLCGAAVAHKLAWALALAASGGERASDEHRALLLELLPLVALGTIADVVPLSGENRILARHGLAMLPQTRLVGLRALMASAGLNGDRVSGYDVGFKLAPRINAAGRMGHARLAVELLTRADEQRAEEIAAYLEEHNRKRQSTESKITRLARERIDKHNLAGDARRAIVVAGDGWHPGVVGIVASRLVDRYHRPAVVISTNGDEGQGSARSIEHFVLSEALAACDELLISHGGHARAAGLRIAADRIDEFTEAFVSLANNALTPADMIPSLRLDAEVCLSQLDLGTAGMIENLGPFGAGNPKPRLATQWIELAAEPRCVGKGEAHLAASFRENGTTMRAIGFGLGERIEDLKEHRRCRAAFEPTINEFRGNRTVEMQLLDLEFPG